MGLPGLPAAPLMKGKPTIRPVTRRIATLALALSLSLVAGWAWGAERLYRASAQDARGATFEITPQPARFDTVIVSTGTYARVSVPGAYVPAEPGHPAPPLLSISVGVPDGMSAKAKIVSAEWVERTRTPPPLPVMRQAYVGDDPDTHLPISEERYEPDPPVYGHSAVWPHDM